MMNEAPFFGAVPNGRNGLAASKTPVSLDRERFFIPPLITESAALRPTFTSTSRVEITISFNDSYTYGTVSSFFSSSFNIGNAVLNAPP